MAFTRKKGCKVRQELQQVLTDDWAGAKSQVEAQMGRPREREREREREEKRSWERTPLGDRDRRTIAGQKWPLGP